LTGEKFLFFGDSLVLICPDSIFGKRFSPGGLNTGKEQLPSFYRLDRDPALFGRFFDPVLRGYPGVCENELETSETLRKKIEADCDFYQIDVERVLVPSSPVPVRRPEDAKFWCTIDWCGKALLKLAPHGDKELFREHGGRAKSDNSENYPVVQTLRIWRDDDSSVKARLEIRFDAETKAQLKKMIS
jgi:hypothetical protein